MIVIDDAVVYDLYVFYSRRDDQDCEIKLAGG
jgi:hypothetical protein